MDDGVDTEATLIGHAQRQTETLERLLRLHYVVVFAVFIGLMAWVVWLIAVANS